jgi:hypothetical protein
MAKTVPMAADEIRRCSPRFWKSCCSHAANHPCRRPWRAHEQPQQRLTSEDTTDWESGDVQGEEWTMNILSDDGEPLTGKLAQLGPVLK